MNMYTNEPVRLGIVGAGQRGMAYYTNILKVPEARLTGLCDTDPGRLDAFARRWRLDGTLQTTTLDEMLKGDRVEAVLVTTPDNHHAAVAIRCFQAGKDVLLEKPLAPTTEESRAIVRAQRSSGKLLQVGFTLRCTGFYRKVKEIVDAGTLGQIMFVDACEYLSVAHVASFQTRWHRKKANAGTFLLSKCSHDLDILNWLIGSKPTHVASFGGIDYFLPSRAPARYCSECPQATSCRYKNDPAWHYTQGEVQNGRRDICVYNDDKDILDNQVLILQYANKVRATFQLQAFYPRESTRRITIGGERAYLDGTFNEGKIILRFSDGDRTEVIDASPTEESGHMGGDIVLTREFARAVRTRKGTLAGAEAGLAANVIADAAERARMQMGVVEIDPRDYQLYEGAT